MSYGEVLRLPIRAFWGLNRMINRVAAEEDTRAVRVGLAAQGGEAAKDTLAALSEEMGQMFVLNTAAKLEEEPEPGAFDKLRALLR